ncbi:uncharacterized protein [Diadema antillarum]|uniref:uncharacterized protein n=1 Tax=Diadema antillarum TaxID=105358 RepID=UPI003A89E129
MDRIGLSTSAATLVILLSQYVTWSGATCPAPSVDHSLVIYDSYQKMYDNNTRLTLECKFSDKSIEIFCDGDSKQWKAGSLSNADEKFQCPTNPVTSPSCLPPDIDPSVATYEPKQEVYASGERVTVECKYSTNWPQIYCDGDKGIWKDDPSRDQAFVLTCQDSPQPCSPPSVDSSRVAIMGTPLASYPPGSNVTLECKYTDRRLTVHCEVYGDWKSGTEEFYAGDLTCPEDPALGPHCGKPNVDPSIATYDVHQDAYADGSQMTVSCKYSDDTASIFCDAANGVWRFSWAFTFELDCPSSGSVNIGLLAGIFAGVFVVSLISGIIRVAIRRHRRTEIAFVRM